jgi:ABC-2 type transport system ATP-binding protein
MPPLLEIKQLIKQYDGFAAVRGISFSITQGSCFGLLGPNGAGKTTTIEVIEDILPPTSGAIIYKGAQRMDSFREEIGIQFQQTALLGFLSVYETLATMKALYRQTLDLEHLIELCHLSDIRDQMNDKISGGQRQRLLLALALLNNPELLFLDEPSTGLDPQARRNLWQIVRQVKEQGKTIILTTHYMEEAQHLCDEIAIMDNGQIIAKGSPAELIRAHCGQMTLRLPEQHVTLPLEGFPFKSRFVQDYVEFQAEDTNEIIKALMDARIDLTHLTMRAPNLEDVFLVLTGRKLRD